MSDSTKHRKTLGGAPTATETSLSPGTDELAAAASTAPIGGGLGAYFQNYIRRVRGGDMGSLPAVGGLVALCIIFSVLQSSFHGLNNMANVVQQAAPTILLAMGLVFVLLLGEIDLSAGTAAGVCAATMAKLLTDEQWAWPLAVIAAMVVGIVIGFFIGFCVAKFRVPSFVVSLATFLAFQGVVLWILGGGGNISIHSNVVNDLENGNMPKWGGWLMLAILVVGYLAMKLSTAVGRRSRNLPSEPMILIALKVGALIVLGGLFVGLLNQNRALQKGPQIKNVGGKLVKVTPTLEGVPWIVPFLLILFVILTFVLTRLRYGRHVYAVGGNAEAARRAGIPVDRVRISVFVICSFLASLGGIAMASQLTSVDANEGNGNTLLLAVGAAVIGGTSLFGGKGRIIDALIGGLVVAVIQNGMADLVHGNNSTAIQEIVTGAVLLIAAGVDAMARRRAGAAGLG